MSTPFNFIQHNHTQASTSFSPNPFKSDESEKDKSTSQVHKPIVRFSNRLKNNMQNSHMHKIIEIFNQMKINVPLFIPSNKSHPMQNFLRTCAPRRERLNVPKKVFLATNISELLSGPITVKYKDPDCPTIPDTIGQAEISHALLDLGASINLLPFSVYQQFGMDELSPTRVTIQLTDRSVKVSKEKINDIFIRVGKFIYPIDFIVLET